MKVQYYCNNGANIHSERTETFDTELDFGIPDEEWVTLTQEEKEVGLEDWVYNRLEYGIRELG